MAPSMPSQLAGLALFVLVVAVLCVAHRVSLRVRRRLVLAAAERPLPGRTKDLTSFPAERAS